MDTAREYGLTRNSVDFSTVTMSSDKNGAKNNIVTIDLTKSFNLPDDGEDDEGFSSRSSKDPVILPTAPRAAREPRIDEENIPTNPYVAYTSNRFDNLDETDMADLFTDVKKKGNPEANEINADAIDTSTLNGFGDQVAFSTPIANSFGSASSAQSNKGINRALFQDTVNQVEQFHTNMLPLKSIHQIRKFNSLLRGENKEKFKNYLNAITNWKLLEEDIQCILQNVFESSVLFHYYSWKDQHGFLPLHTTKIVEVVKDAIKEKYDIQSDEEDDADEIFKNKLKILKRKFKEALEKEEKEKRRNQKKNRYAFVPEL